MEKTIKVDTDVNSAESIICTNIQSSRLVSNTHVRQSVTRLFAATAGQIPREIQSKEHEFQIEHIYQRLTTQKPMRQYDIPIPCLPLPKSPRTGVPGYFRNGILTAIVVQAVTVVAATLSVRILKIPQTFSIHEAGFPPSYLARRTDDRFRWRRQSARRGDKEGEERSEEGKEEVSEHFFYSQRSNH